MSSHRSSYKKTTILAAVVGATSFVASLVLLWMIFLGSVGGTKLIPSLLFWGAALLAFALGILGLAVAVGGILALCYDARGRAYF
jgi:hypothetical protein